MKETEVYEKDKLNKSDEKQRNKATKEIKACSNYRVTEK